MEGSNSSSILFLNHDIRNYIGVAISHAQLLTRQNPLLANEAHITAITDSLKQAILLSEQLASKGKLETQNGACSYNKSELTLFSLNEDYYKKINASYQKFGRIFPINFNLTYTIRHGDYFVRLDMEALKALRLNLIHNAVKSGATRIDASYEMKDYGFVVTLRDNGSGMDQEVIDQIILSQYGESTIEGLGTKRIFKTAHDSGFFVSFTSEKRKGTTYRAVCPYVKP